LSNKNLAICITLTLTLNNMNLFNYLKKILLGGIFKERNMGVRFGPFDPLQLTIGILDTLLRKKLLSVQEIKIIIKDSLPPDSEMSPEEKEKLLNSMVREDEEQSASVEK
jgi:hypothetical protein